MTALDAFRSSPVSTCAADQAGFSAWLADWLDWLTTSTLGLEESVSSNNHQTYYDATVVAAAVWTGNVSLGLAVLRGTLEPPPVGHINAPLGVQVCVMRGDVSWR